MTMSNLNNEIHELNIDELDFVSGGDGRLFPVLAWVVLDYGHKDNSPGPESYRTGGGDDGGR
jgi:hypothetical protein